MIRFQCCVGPSSTKAHLRRADISVNLTLCERTTPAVDFKGVVPKSKLCPLCLRRMMELLPVGHGIINLERLAVVIGARNVQEG